MDYKGSLYVLDCTAFSYSFYSIVQFLQFGQEVNILYNKKLHCKEIKPDSINEKITK